MLIRDLLILRILTALLVGPLHAYGIIKRISSDDIMLTPIEERAIYRLLPKLAASDLIKQDVQLGKPVYQLGNKAYPILRSELQRLSNLTNLMRKRLM